MMEFRVLWVDDHWSDRSLCVGRRPPESELAQWEEQWVADLAAHGIQLHITRRDSGLIADDLTRQRFNALILDYELSEDPNHVEANAFKLLERLRSGIKSLPPVAIFSRYSSTELRSYLKGQIRGSVWAVFEKTPEGARGVARFMKNAVLRGALSFVVISDLHAGYLEETGGIDPKDFVHSLARDVECVAASVPVDGIIVPGDLAWRSQRVELRDAYAAVKRLRFAARLDRPEQFIFCPGNHDLDFSDAAVPWRHFSEFVDLLALGPDESFSSRFVVAWNDSLQQRSKFETQESLLSLVHNTQRGVVFAAFNSCLPTGKGFDVLPAIAETQWTALQRALDGVPARTFRIAVLHHPLFSTPGGVYKDDPSLADQGKAIQLLSKLGFGLVLHGHTHFAGIHSHRLRVLNGAPRGRSVSKILTISCPSVIANPSSVSPHRQYFVLRLGPFDETTGTRSLSLATRVFDPKDRSWSAGEEVAAGEFDVESAE